jgi:hypothetical protein
MPGPIPETIAIRPASNPSLCMVDLLFKKAKFVRYDRAATRPRPPSRRLRSETIRRAPGRTTNP